MNIDINLIGVRQMSRFLSQSAALSFAALLAVALWTPTVAPVSVMQADAAVPVLA